jgi:hypothetical protein
MRHIIFLSLALVANSAWAQQPGWIVDTRSGCRVQNPHPVPNESIQWSGGCQGGLAEGRGSLQWFANGKPGSRTEGEWHAGVLNGRALTLSPDGSRYEGEYRDGVPNGRGVTTFANGNRLDATYRDGRANGRGIATLVNGSKFDGDFVDDAIVRGIQTWPNGNRYEGEFKNFVPDGKGRMTQTNGTSYEGEFKAGNWEGQAVVRYAVGDVYQGEWRGLFPNGRGTLHRKSGNSFTGRWIEGCLSQANSDNGLWATAGKSAAECGFQ